jgi:hypothetical protein
MNPGWLDLSDYVVHFTKDGDQASYQTMMSILWQRRLVRGPAAFGAARHIPWLADSQRAVCFSEVPLGFLERIAARRNSKYGIAFSKRFLLDRGGAPLWYLEHGTLPYEAFRSTIEQHATTPNLSDPLWRLTPFVDFPSGPISPYKYDFRWEREWRITADITFTEADVAFLLIPEHNHAAARTFFQQTLSENLGPSYLCLYFDPTWTVDRVWQALQSFGPK